jgi:hypothetical protein
MLSADSKSFKYKKLHFLVNELNIYSILIFHLDLEIIV